MQIEHPTTQPDTSVDLDVLIVGAGFAGMYAIHLLRKQNMTCRAFEAGSDVGGTWYWNRYPGARCDVESFDYCYSFSEEVHQEWNWSERFATQPEILRYAGFVADRLDLRRDISFDSQVTAMTWDDESGTWLVTVADGHQVRARFVISAVGLLSVSNRTNIPGVDSFQGRMLHTGHWPHEGVDFTGRRVAVIGTGSSAIQAIPEIARRAEHLTVFQRTPNFVIPARNRPLTGRELARAKDDLPFIREHSAASVAGFFTARGARSVFDFQPDQVREELERRWAIGGTEFLGAFQDTMISREANEIVAQFVRDKISEIVHDPETATKLQPRDHPIASKRPVIGTDYYETFNRPNVDLVDVRTEPIEAITATGVRTASGEYEVDDLVMAVGYDAITGPIVRLNVEGRGGLTIGEYWKEGARSYLGIATAGFPNLFTVTGPLSATALTNVVRSLEHHVEWIVQCIAYMGDHDLRTIEATAEAEEGWDVQVTTMGNYTFYPEVASWYTGGNIEGKARKLLMWVGGFDKYREICDEVANTGYGGFVFDAHQREATKQPAEVSA